MSTTRATRFLKAETNIDSPSSTSDNTDAVDSDFVVILAALLCALICVLGLVAVARCAWLRRFSAGVSGSLPTANKGLKKKVLKSLPKVPYSPENHAGKLAEDCAICLSEFESGEEIRVLPQCGHGFHVTCIDMWLGSHSSCPSCRQILGVSTVSASVRCQKCGGGLPESGVACSSSSSSADVALPLQPLPPPSPTLIPDRVGDSFLP